MKYVSLRDFQLKASPYLKALPIVLTVYGVPKYIVSTFEDSKKPKPTPKPTPQPTSLPHTTQPAPAKPWQSKQGLKSLVPKGFMSHKCAWDKGYTCPSPGVYQKKGKWYCLPHFKLA